MMKQPESTVNVKMHEFGQLLDEVLDASYECEIRGLSCNSDHAFASRYRLARERLVGMMRASVEIVISQNDTGASKVGWMGDIGGNPYGPFDR